MGFWDDYVFAVLMAGMSGFMFFGLLAGSLGITSSALPMYAGVVSLLGAAVLVNRSRGVSPAKQ